MDFRMRHHDTLGQRRAPHSFLAWRGMHRTTVSTGSCSLIVHVLSIGESMLP